MPILALTFKKLTRTWLTRVKSLYRRITGFLTRKKVIYLLSEKNGEKYAGKYVCLKKFGSKKVVAANEDPALALAEAKRKGYEHPVTFYVPPENSVQIYCACA
jgi:hypothetical protein